MALEAVLAVVVGLLALWIVLEPLVRPRTATPLPDEPLDPEETPKGVALTALKEIEFDRADRETVRRGLRAAQGALHHRGSGSAPGRGGERRRRRRRGNDRSPRARSPLRWRLTPPSAPECPTCGPRPEPDAVFCSSCGLRLQAPASCPRCTALLPQGSRFCETCGESRVAA